MQIARAGRHRATASFDRAAFGDVERETTELRRLGPGFPGPPLRTGDSDIVDAAGRTITVPDACDSERYVREGRCPEEPTDIDAQLGYYLLAVCVNGCRDGACTP